MSYATQQQLVDRFGEHLLLDLTDRADVPTGTINAGVVTRALTDTDAMIDGYLAGRYKLPLVQTPPIITDLAATIAIYKLHTYDPPGKIKDDYEHALKQLAMISKGDIRLPAEGVEPTDRKGNGVITTDRPRPFSNENLQGFV